ncbi:MAG: hypothetical protein ACNI27_15225 [Desulfovibrio sp.]
MKELTTSFNTDLKQIFFWMIFPAVIIEISGFYGSRLLFDTMVGYASPNTFFVLIGLAIIVHLAVQLVNGILIFFRSTFLLRYDNFFVKEMYSASILVCSTLAGIVGSLMVKKVLRGALDGQFLEQLLGVMFFGVLLLVARLSQRRASLNKGLFRLTEEYKHLRWQEIISVCIVLFYIYQTLEILVHFFLKS